MTTFERLDELTDRECRAVVYKMADRIGGEHVTPTDLLRWINQALDSRRNQSGNRCRCVWDCRHEWCDCRLHNQSGERE